MVIYREGGVRNIFGVLSFVKGCKVEEFRKSVSIMLWGRGW